MAIERSTTANTETKNKVADKNDQASRDIEVAKSKEKIAKLDQESQEAIQKIIDELDNLRNDPAMLDKLNDASLMSILQSHGILVQDIQNLLAMIEYTDHQKHLAEIGAGDLTQTSDVIQSKLTGLGEAWNRLGIDLNRKVQEAAPGNQAKIAQLASEVQEAQGQTNILLDQVNALE